MHFPCAVFMTARHGRTDTPRILHVDYSYQFQTTTQKLSSSQSGRLLFSKKPKKSVTRR